MTVGMSIGGCKVKWDGYLDEPTIGAELSQWRSE